jgi:hypothetical protein
MLTKLFTHFNKKKGPKKEPYFFLNLPLCRADCLYRAYINTCSAIGTFIGVD